MRYVYCRLPSLYSLKLPGSACAQVFSRLQRNDKHGNKKELFSYIIFRNYWYCQNLSEISVIILPDKSDKPLNR